MKRINGTVKYEPVEVGDADPRINHKLVSAAVRLFFLKRGQRSVSLKELIHKQAMGQMHRKRRAVAA